MKRLLDKNQERQIAKIVSIILSPIFIWPAILTLLISRSGLVWVKDAFVISALYTLLILIPFGTLVYFFATKRIKDIDLTDRKDRIVPLFFSFFCCFLAILLLTIFKNTFLLKYLTVAMIVLVANLGVTLFWKISLHMAINTLFAFYFSMLLGSQYYVLFLLLPVVFWSRYLLKKHTSAQLLVGFFLNAGIILLCVSII